MKQLFLVVSAALMMLPTVAGNKSSGTGNAPVPVPHFGGRAVLGSEAFVLDLDPAGVVILIFEGAELRKVVRLSTGQLKIEPYGIALDVERRFHVLGNRGRVDVTIDRAKGSVVNVTDLEIPCQGIWNVGPEILLAPLRTQVAQVLVLCVGLGTCP